MSKISFQKLLLDMEQAAKAIKTELEKRWPIGSTIFVNLHTGQKAPTIMTVLGHDGYRCTVKASMPSKSKYSRYPNFVIDVYFTEIR